MVGLPGTAAGVTILDSTESAPFPTRLTARTLSRYAVPLVRPPTSMSRAFGSVTTCGLPTWVWVPASTTTTSYPVTADPPSLSGASQVTLAEPSPAVAVRRVGAPGTVAASGFTVLDGAEYGPGPTPLTARTLNWNDLSLLRPDTTTLAVPAPSAAAPPAASSAPPAAAPPAAVPPAAVASNGTVFTT